MAKHKKQTKDLQITPSTDKIRGALLNTLPSLSRLNKNLEEFSAILSNHKDKDRSEKANEKHREIMRALELDSHISLIESFDKEFRDFVAEMSSQTIKEYGCSTAIEKALAEVITNGFIRFIDNSQRLNAILNDTNISHAKNSHFSILSKQTDRAQRQFIGAIMALKQLRAPSVEMNIKTTNAFLAENQQINVDKKINEAK